MVLAYFFLRITSCMFDPCFSLPLDLWWPVEFSDREKGGGGVCG